MVRRIIEKIKQKKNINELLEFGIINIDKPSGPTSFKVDEIIKNKLKLRKTSHFGTLDPKVTGVLPIALNRACKLLRWFMKGKKTYVGIMKLHKSITEKKLEKEMEKFVGRIKQVPPRKSRVKREERKREVYSWKLLEYDKGKKEALFEAEVEAGTYIRKLISQLGENIGGAHMSALRRTEASIFSEDDGGFVNLYEIEKAVKEYEEGKEKRLKAIIIPAEVIIKVLPVVYVKEEATQKLLTGKPISSRDIEKKVEFLDGENVAVFCKDKFIEVARIVSDGEIIARPEFVFN